MLCNLSSLSLSFLLCFLICFFNLYYCMPRREQYTIIMVQPDCYSILTFLLLNKSFCYHQFNILQVFRAFSACCSSIICQNITGIASCPLFTVSVWSHFCQPELFFKFCLQYSRAFLSLCV